MAYQRWTLRTEAVSRDATIPFDIYVRDNETLEEYVCELDDKFIARQADIHHTIFTSARMSALIEKMVAAGTYNIDRDRESDRIVNVWFRVDCEVYEQKIADVLLIQCHKLSMSESEHKIKLLQLELARIREHLAENLTLSRQVAINAMVMDAEHRFGPIPPYQYDFARKIFAAEFDGTPYIFPCINFTEYESIAVPWVRSVIRIVTVSPFTRLYQIQYLRCTRLVIAFDGWSMENQVEFNRFREHCCRHCLRDTHHYCSTPSVNIHDDVHEVVFKLKRGKPHIYENIATIARNMRRVSSITIDSEMRDSFRLEGAFADATIVPLAGRNMEEYNIDALHDALESAREHTKNITIPYAP